MTFNDHLPLLQGILLDLPFHRVNYTCMRTRNRTNARAAVVKSGMLDVSLSTYQ
jgi:hypothetical protein